MGSSVLTMPGRGTSMLKAFPFAIPMTSSPARRQRIASRIARAFRAFELSATTGSLAVSEDSRAHVRRRKRSAKRKRKNQRNRATETKDRMGKDVRHGAY